jgi:YgiT-type zinc finger domain-containing protein
MLRFLNKKNPKINYQPCPLCKKNKLLSTHIKYSTCIYKGSYKTFVNIPDLPVDKCTNCKETVFTSESN